MIDSTNPRVMADNIRDLSKNQAAQGAELESKIEALGSYSTDEVNTGKKFLGFDVFRKVIEIEHLPNTATESYPHGITNLKDIIEIVGYIPAAADFAGRPIPYSNNILLRWSSSVIQIITTSDLSARSGVIYIEYTKAATPTPDVLPSPDPDTRSLEEPEPIEEKK